MSSYEDRITIATPEGIEVELALAGLGSRMAAAIVDLSVQLVVLVGLGLAATALGPAGLPTGYVAGIYAVVAFAVLFGYHVAFECLNTGRTPGKQLTGLRVVLAGGHPVGFAASAVRNLVRMVDGPPFLYPLGALVILLSPRNQRLGDLAAGTVVIRDRRLVPDQRASTPPATHDAGTWDVSAVGSEHVAILRRFLQRRDEMDQQARQRIAAELAEGLRRAVVGVPDGLGSEQLIEGVLAAKSAL